MTTPNPATEAKHTPLPWLLRPTGVLASVNGNIRFIADARLHGDGGREMDAQDKSDGEFIVTACNSHAALKAACEKAARDCSICKGSGQYEQQLTGGKRQTVPCGKCAQLRSALALAGKDKTL